ncbi:hypothetical protein [Thermosphaera chiliense]|nr:hypothetical protein [Thermosphaera aggregans]
MRTYCFFSPSFFFSSPEVFFLQGMFPPYLIILIEQYLNKKV